MVLQKTIDILKSRPRHERRAVARVIALSVAAVLFIGWVIVFFNNIRANGIQIEPIGNPGQSAFDTAPLTEAQDQIANSFSGIKENIQAIQSSAASQQGSASQSVVPAQTAY